MKASWLVQNGSPQLILFFAGWGMDPRPFVHLQSETDVLLFYDYRSMAWPVELEELLSCYESCRLLTWSLGTTVANSLCMEFREQFEEAVAINGTVIPADDQCGIPPALFDRTIASHSPEGLTRFQRRMLRDRELLARYRRSAPHRSFDDLGQELHRLRHLAPADETLFTGAIVSSQDHIITTTNQINCWKRFNVPYRVIDEPHFPFYRWSCWEEICFAD